MKSIVILVMGLPDSGKSNFSGRLRTKLNEFCKATWINADAVRAEYNDWDFSTEGRARQASRMKGLAARAVTDLDAEVVILDFVCPIPAFREVVDPDIIVFMDTKEDCVYEDTKRMFIPPDLGSERIRCLPIKVENFDVFTSALHEVADEAARLLGKTEKNRLLHKGSHLRSIVKGFTYRCLGSLTTMGISFLFTRSVPITLSITGMEVMCKVFIYYLHERVWNKI